MPKRTIIVEATENGEQHVYPKGYGHEPTPLCFCEPHLSVSCDKVWCHFPDMTFIKIALDIKP